MPLSRLFTLPQRNIKCLLLIIIISSYQFSCKQNTRRSFTLTGDIKGLKDAYIFLDLPVGDSSKRDSAAVTSGHFVVKDSIAEPSMGFLFTSRNYLRVFLENSDIHIKGNVDSFWNSKISGSLSHSAYDSLNASVEGLTEQADSLSALLRDDTDMKIDPGSKSAIQARLSALKEQKMERIRAYILKYPESQVGVYKISEFALRNYPVLEMEKLFNLLDTAAQQSGAGKTLKKRLTILKRGSIGEPMNDFTQDDVNKRPVAFAQYNKGKYVLVDFWASWCHPCRAENPNVLKAYHLYKDKGLDILGVSLDEDSAAWKKAVLEDKLPWTQVSDLKGWQNAVAVAYGIRGIPDNFLVDPNGIIVAKDLRGAELEQKLAELLNRRLP
jgi:thiol-disulfide isomerase/thioredoxin